MSSKIIFIEQRTLAMPSLAGTINQYQYNWNNLVQLGDWLNFSSFYPRAGINNIPLDNSIVTDLNYTMPVYDINFNKSFADITDSRCREIVAHSKNRPCIIMYSGGIDSTVIVASILKNTSQADRENIIIACNNISIYENPRFFIDYIQPNFQIISSETVSDNTLRDHYLIDGEPADQLYSGGVSQGMLLANSTALTQNVHSDPDNLLKYLTTSTDKKFARWFYELLIENIKSVNVPIETYHDFFWWFQFNYTWVGVKLRNRPNSRNPLVLQRYFDNFIQWYDTTEYQLWSMKNNQLGIKFKNNIGDYKLASKQYIYNLDHNEYFFKFKIKQHSVSLAHPTTSTPFCILDDLTTLWLDRDLDRILKLLPTHIIQ